MTTPATSINAKIPIVTLTGQFLFIFLLNFAPYENRQMDEIDPMDQIVNGHARAQARRADTS